MRLKLLLFSFFICGYAKNIHCQAMFELPDSLKIVDTIFTSCWEENIPVKYSDSINAFQRHLYRLDRLKPWSDITLGNTGSQHTPSTFILDKEPGLRLGYNGMNTFRWIQKDVKFYSTNVALSNVSATLGTSFTNSSTSVQENALATAFFTRNFDNRINFSLNYRNINEKGMYVRDQSKHTQVMLQFNQWNEEKSFFWFASWIRNAFNRQDNGGVDKLELLQDSVLYEIRENMPVYHSDDSDAGYRDASNLYSFGWQWILSSKKGMALKLSNLSSSEIRSFKYYLQSATELNSFYNNIHIEGSGLRNAFELKEYSNDASLEWSSSIFKTIKVGYRYSYSKIDDNILGGLQQFGTLYSKVKIDYQKNILFSIDSYIETLEEAGDFNLNGRLDLARKGLGQISGYSSIGRQSPNWATGHLALNDEVIFSKNLPTMSYFQIGGEIDFSKYGISLKASQSILNGYSYYDENFEIKTDDDVVSVTEFEVISEVSLRHWNFLNSFIFQLQDDQIFTLPAWQSRHVLFYSGKVRKNGMIFRLGVEGEVRNMKYQPRFVEFNEYFIPTRLNIENDGLLYRIDPYAQFDISTFSVFFKGENIQSLWWDKPFIHIVNRPTFDWRFRIGINWRFLN